MSVKLYKWKIHKFYSYSCRASTESRVNAVESLHCVSFLLKLQPIRWYCCGLRITGITLCKYIAQWVYTGRVAPAYICVGAWRIVDAVVHNYEGPRKYATTKSSLWFRCTQFFAHARYEMCHPLNLSLLATLSSQRPWQSSLWRLVYLHYSFNCELVWKLLVIADDGHCSSALIRVYSYIADLLS